MISEEYKRVIALLGEPTLLVTGSGRLLAVNEAAGRLLSLARDDLPNNSLNNFSDTPTSELATYLRACSGSKQEIIGALVINAPDGPISFTAKGAVLEPRAEGTEAIVLLRLFPKAEANARFVALKEHVDELNRELINHQRLNYQLRTQKQWLQVTLKSIGDAVITTDPDGNVTFLNPVAQALTGWKKKEALGKPLTNVFVVLNEDSRATVENPVDKVLRERRIVELANHSVLIAKNGEEIPIEDTAAPIMLDHQLEGVVLVFHDVSAKRSLQKQLFERAERLEEANRRKSEFLVMLAHELRNPLTPISNAVQILQREPDNIELTRETHHIIARQVRHMTRLVDDMLDVSRITRGKIHIERESMDLASLLRVVCQDIQPQFDEAGIELAVSIPASGIWLDADPTRITQVLDNLLGNARKFTPRRGRVQVTLSTAKGQAMLSIADTGIGIDPVLIPELFEPFTQAAQSLDRSSGGLGLGLSVAKGIVELHGGEITVQSAGKQRGATFTVKLPLAIPRQVPAEKPCGIRGKRYRFLVIEDNVDAATTMRMLLELLGHEVHIAHTGPAGLEQAFKVMPEVIICDIGLPDMDGFAVAEKLRADSRTASVLLIALTGYSQSSFAERTRQAGFDRHLVKPVTIEIIQEAIESLSPA